ncbi:hypothetical protein N9192_01060 [Akkermansiaceae bacterium]|nr:hypothetical protein [Akkermansiaceae bacterium]
MTGKDAAQYSAIEQEDDDRDDYSKERFFDDSTGKKKPEVAEDETTRADMVRRAWTKKPEGEASCQNNEERRLQENSLSSDENEATEHNRWQRVGDEVTESQMQKRGG